MPTVVESIVPSTANKSSDYNSTLDVPYPIGAEPGDTLICVKICNRAMTAQGAEQPFSMESGLTWETLASGSATPGSSGVNFFCEVYKKTMVVGEATVRTNHIGNPNDANDISRAFIFVMRNWNLPEIASYSVQPAYMGVTSFVGPETGMVTFEPDNQRYVLEVFAQVSTNNNFTEELLDIDNSDLEAYERRLLLPGSLAVFDARPTQQKVYAGTIGNFPLSGGYGGVLFRMVAGNEAYSNGPVTATKTPHTGYQWVDGGYSQKRDAIAIETPLLATPSNKVYWS